jgi:hypothetical protein
MIGKGQGCTTVRILVDQRGNSNKIWAQIVTISDGKGKGSVIHGPNRKNGAGLVENQSSANWQDKQKKGYQMLATLEGVPKGMEKICVAAIAHLQAGESQYSFVAESDHKTAYGRKCAAALVRQWKWGDARDIAINLLQDETDPTPLAEPVQEQETKPKHDLSNLLKSTRRSGFF